MNIVYLPDNRAKKKCKLASEKRKTHSMKRYYFILFFIVFQTIHALQAHNPNEQYRFEANSIANFLPNNLLNGTNAIFSVKSWGKSIHQISQNNLSFLKTWGVTIILSSLVIIIMIGICCQRIKKIKKRNLNLEKQVQENTLEIKNKSTLLKRRQNQIKKHKNILQEQKESLEELNSMKDKLFSIIAHDLKSPFQSVLGFSDLLCNQYESLQDNQKKKYIQIINTSSHKIFNLLENLLTWAMTQTGNIAFKKEKIELASIIDQNIELLKENINNKGIIINKNLKDNTTVNADINMISTSFRNLLSNAVKFTNAGGEIFINLEKNYETTRISVKDNGIGMDKETLKTLFELDKIDSTKGTAGESGTGLGLILCKEFIDMSGGKIWAESTPGEGSTFCIELPISN